MKFDSSLKAIVSGGVSGLGGAVAEKVVAAGGQVAMLDISDDKGNAMAAKLGARAKYIKCNVADDADVPELSDLDRHVTGLLSRAMR